MTVSSVYSESQFITVGVQFGSLASSIILVKVIFCNVPEKSTGIFHTSTDEYHHFLHILYLFEYIISS